MSKRILRAIDLCCGAGGWAAAARGLPIEWVAVADIAPDCLETWKVNHADRHPDCELLCVDLSTQRGIRRVPETAGAVDIVVGGIPCEQVSVARGASKVSSNEMDRWYKLIDGCLEIVDLVEADYWALEDVIQIEKHLPLPLLHGREIPFQRIDASDFGPQRRIRTFLGKFPKPSVPSEPGPRTLEAALRPGPHLMISGAETYEGVYAFSGGFSMNNDKMRLLSRDKPCPTIVASIGTSGGRQKRTFTVVDDRGRRRMLSWQEAATVQGFPDDYLFVGSFTRAAQMVGRAIPIQVGRAILEAIVKDVMQRELAEEALQRELA